MEPLLKYDKKSGMLFWGPPKRNSQHNKSSARLASKVGLLVLLPLLWVVFSLQTVTAQVTYTFLPGAATGLNGPTQAQLNTAYTGSNLASKVTSLTGKQRWIVPSSGVYKIKITGASAGNATSYTYKGGLGASMQGEFALVAGDTIIVLIGQKGSDGGGAGGGGGGTFVTRNGTLLIAAGGGGGATSDNHGANATTATTGTNDVPASFTPGGTNGGGGLTCNSSVNNGGGGGGYIGDGATSTGGTGQGAGGQSFLNGGLGGNSTGVGGFGGGGGVTSITVGGGGGGGYSGGAGGQQVNYCYAGLNRTGGGGGGSFNSGIRQTNVAGVQTGNGTAIFEVLSSNAYNDAGVIAVDSPTVYCIGSNSVVATVMNYGKNKITSVRLNWSVNGVTQTFVNYTGSIDTIGGSGSRTALINLGNYTFTSAATTIRVWSSIPNGVADTVKTNDSAIVVKTANLPAPIGVATGTLTTSSAVITWVPGAVQNRWAYLNFTAATTPVGPGTIVSSPSASITGLQPRTTYYFYVREICLTTNDSSVWRGPFIYKTPCVAPLNGTYTINPTLPPSTTNFVNFTEAVAALTDCSITGPVTFNVSAATFTERLVFADIPGSSATNRVTFVGAGRGNTILTNAGSSTANMATVTFNGTDYVTFRDMTVRGTNVTYGTGFMLTNQANYNTFENMHIQMVNSSTAATTAGIALTGSLTAHTTSGNNGSYNTFDSLLVEGAYYGIVLYGSGTTLLITNNTITNCNFTQQYYYNVYTYYNNKLLLDNNNTSPLRVTTGSGFYLNYTSNSRISNNTINSNYYGIYNYYFNSALYDNTVRSLIYNNSLHSSSYYAYYATNSTNYDFYNNSLNSTSASTARLTTGSGVLFVNNQIKNYRNTAASYAMYITSVTFDSLDYNNYMSYSSSEEFYHDAAYTKLADYRKAFPTYNLNSYNVEPNFISNTNLHIDQSKINLRGINTGIDTDIDGDTRCAFAPTLGADESLYPTPTPKSVIAIPDSVYENSPAIFISAYSPAAGVALDYTWYINGVQVGKGRDYPVKLAAGNHTVALKVRSCQANDSSSSNFKVIAPTSTPVSDFTASKLIVDLTEETKFSDLSRFGPTKWDWSASPAVDVVWTDPTVSNPTAFFLESGLYEICLTTENANGTGTTKCKSEYISVNDDKTMCSSPSSTFTTGRITDEGGTTGIYNSSTSCSFLIKPCADKVYLKFSEFDLADAGDVLKVYDGVDNTATLLGTFTYGASLPGGSTGLIANSGKIFLEWNTNGAGASKGFVANWTSTPDLSTPAPVADFSAIDTVFNGRITRFESSSTGTLLSYAWDFDPPNNIVGLEGGKSKSDRYRWNSAGNYDVTLKVTNCGGSSSITKSITVVDPVSKPVIGFYANKRRAPVLNTVTFFDTSRQGPSTWKWEITPSASANIVGPNNEEQLKVSFSKSGFYTVKLVATNINGADSLIKVNYIDIFDYCDPVASSISSDMGISRVKLGSITNASSVGVSRFTSYLNDFVPVKMYRKGSMDITIERNTTIDSMNRKVWIDWNNDGDFNDSLELALYEPAAKTLSYSASFAIPNFANLGFTTLRIGTSYGSNKNTPCGINPAGEFEDYPLEIAIDDVLPVITINGKDTVRVEQWHQYTDAGATATDNIDGNLTSVIQLTNNVDTTKVGTYYVTYKVTDNEGNAGITHTRVVIVTPDVTKPVITLIGNAVEKVIVNNAYTDLGATAMDYFNRNITGSITSGNNLNLTLLGSYSYWYVVADAAGNKDSVVRTVNVVDDVAPVLALNGTDTLVVEVNTPVVDPGYTSSDNYYSAVSVTVNNSMVDITKVGIYPMVYTAKDSSGNTTVVTRYIDVQDNTAPVIKLVGRDTVTLDVNTDYFEQGAKVTDNYCKGVLWNVDTVPNTKVIGNYTITYSAVDCENNAAITVKRVVKVVDRMAPVVYLKGLPALTIMRWQPYTDAGVKITDNYYDTTTLKGLLTIKSDVNYLIEGIYSICYEVTDPSGNASNQVCRVVTVGPNTTSINELGNNQIRLYPNPSNGNFTLDFGASLQGDATLTIVDMTGREVYKQNVTALTEKLPVDLVGLPGGVYMARIQEGQNSTVLRITIAR